ncbi:hypothetical protein OQA88_11676 [Cercophora sp. LCS_1]
MAKAVVIGAGLSGLASSIALRRAGWGVTVLEKSRFKNEIGAAITIPPNATRVLDHWGFDSPSHGAVPNQASVFSNASDLKVFLGEEYPDIGEHMGHMSWSFHRVDLHRGLRELAEKLGVVIELGKEVSGVDCENGIVRLKNGETRKGELVVIADGAHSVCIGDFTGRGREVTRTGRSIYRWLVKMEDVNREEDLRECFSGLPGFRSWRDASRDILWVSYTCRDGTILNNALVHATREGEGEEDLWHSEVTRDRVLDLLEGFHETPRKIVSLPNEDGIKVHHLFKRPALESFVRGRTVVVGDAAHVMMPTHAAGGAIGIESAAALEVLFKDVDGTDETLLQERLRLFDQLRIPRCNLTMLASNAGPQWLAVPGVEEDVRRFYSGPLPPAGALPWGRQFREVLFNHDAYRAAEQALAGVAVPA